ncbi:hypothetical protein GGS24DRAFT_309960 [Hypoxylon argillaceum]|nr:hypothetical protein GGS24DRAFT_309960 [Hypoxylon argillaceum]
MAPKSKRGQTRLTFEPIGASSSSPVSTYSPARVRYSRAAHSSPARRLSSTATPSSSAQTANRSSRRKSQQRRLDDTMTPPASFMPRLHGQGNHAVADDSSGDSAAEIGDAGCDDEDVDLLPPIQKATKPHTSESEEPDEELFVRNPRSSQSVSTRLQRTVIIDDSDDEEPEPEPPGLSSPRKRRRSSISSLDSDDAPILPLGSARKLSRPTIVELDSSDEDIVSPLKKRKMVQHSSPSVSAGNRTPGRLKRPNAAVSSPIRKPHKGHRSEKQKTMELLRRRRAGEKIDQLTSSESSSGEQEKRGIYDSDPDRGFEVLQKFDDEEQEEAAEEQPALHKDRQKRKSKKPTDQDNDESDLDDFVTDDDNAPLGAPVDIPLEFTSNAHKPLKDQFPYVIEWLVHNRINPAFERKDPVYVNAWRKLDDEVRGLANSKFTSSAWKVDFNRALKSRPRLESFSLAHLGSGLYETCEACGRSGHPSTFKIIFSGSAYYKDTLAEVESDSDSNDDGEDEDEDNDTASVDTRGMPLPPITKEWCVGSVCCSNAETAHSLLHWKHALKEWVEERLEDEGWMTGEKLSQREKMKAKSRRALANSIVDEWQERRVVTSLYGDFKKTLENARNQATTGRGLRGKFARGL